MDETPELTQVETPELTQVETPELTQVEMVEILKAIARDGGNAAARIAAIKELRAIRAGDKPVVDGFAALDAPVRLKAV